MKPLKLNILSLFAALLALLFAACQKDKPLWGEEEETTPNVLQLSVNTYTESGEVILYPDDDPSKIVLTATWNDAASRGEYYEIIYIFKIDLGTNDFQTPERYEDIKTHSISFTYQDLYDLLTEKWHVKVGESASIDLRIIGEVWGPKFMKPEVVTERVNVKIYAPDPKPLYMMGTAVAGGSNTDLTKTIKMQEVLIGKEYTFTGSLENGNIKFITPQTDTTTLLPSYNKGNDNNTLFLRTDASEPDNLFSITKGTYLITVRLDHLTVTFNKEVQIEGSTWASSNVDEKGTFATAPDELGKLFRFHESVGFSATGQYVSDWPSSTDTDDTYWKSDPCPSGWHLPEHTHLTSLRAAGSSWAAAGERGNTVGGRFFGPGANKVRMDSIANCIFIPAAGKRDSATGELKFSGEKGFVASKNPYWGETSMVLVFDASSISVVMAKEAEPGGADIVLGTGLSVRCIKN